MLLQSTKPDVGSTREPFKDQMLDLLQYAKRFSPFYSSLYAGLDFDDPMFDFKAIPTIDHTTFWSQNSNVPTGPHIDGAVLRTGGTTSNPKFTSYSQSELQRVGTIMGAGLTAAGLRAGDRVGNLFYAGECYASFLLHIMSVASTSLPAVQIPIGGLTATPSIANLIEQCEVTVLLSTVTTLVKLSSYCLPLGQIFPKVHTIMFAGESFFQDQQSAVQAIFPNAKVRSCIFGSIDAGVLATSAGTDDARLFKTLPGAVAVEICPDEDGKNSTTENGVEGSLVVTNFLRRLMPVIRYPVGDRAVWVDYEAGLFRLLGRDQHSVRLGPVSIDYDHMQKIVISTLGDTPLFAFQVVIERSQSKDALLFRIDALPDDPKSVERDITAKLHKERPMFSEHVKLGYIEELRTEFLSITEMSVNHTTGKLKGILDLRGVTKLDFTNKV